MPVRRLSRYLVTSPVEILHAQPHALPHVPREGKFQCRVRGEDRTRPPVALTYGIQSPFLEVGAQVGFRRPGSGPFCVRPLLILLRVRYLRFLCLAPHRNKPHRGNGLPAGGPILPLLDHQEFRHGSDSTAKILSQPYIPNTDRKASTSAKEPTMMYRYSPRGSSESTR